MTTRLENDGTADRCMASLVDSLLAEVESLTTSLTAQFLTDDGRVPDSRLFDIGELRNATRENLFAILEALSKGRPIVLAPAMDAGRAKARQGVPLEALLLIYRLTGRFIWDRLLDLAVAKSCENILLYKASEVWALIDQCSSAAADSYRATVEEQVGRDALARSALLASLFGGDVKGNANAWDILRVLHLDMKGPFLAVYSEMLGDVDSLPTIETLLRNAGIGSGWMQQMNAQLGLLVLPNQQSVKLAYEQLATVARHRVGVSRLFTSPAHAPVARQEAQLAAKCVPPGRRGIHLYGAAPLALLAAASPDTANQVARLILGPLLEAPPAEQSMLIETLDVWFTENGSTTRAAERLHCHRNTILNRLNRVKELTGRSTTAAEPSAELLVALRVISLKVEA
ncbi:helix-turn-helix domain-containing protein [Streptomyces sp. NPDC096934]|uniref:PucR family transcriptional regulator n=1 Tax=Streptomyces sp. NPDC096934 TaxID=3155551 RepID=UPI00333454EE